MGIVGAPARRLDEERLGVALLDVRGVVGFLVGQRGLVFEFLDVLGDSIAGQRPTEIVATSLWVSWEMIGISPVSSATVTASVFPRRRRRRPPTGGAPIVPFFASNSATDIGRVLLWLSSDPVIVCCLWT